MTGLDTNVLVRYLTRDDARQFSKANDLLTGLAEAGETIHVNVIVLCELAEVLESAYRLDKAAIVTALRALLDTARLSIEDRDLVAEAVDAFAEGKAGFADCLIGIRNKAAGCRETATLDTRLRSNRTFRVL
jgi:predicted nucleic-acid-binding protein